MPFYPASASSGTDSFGAYRLLGSPVTTVISTSNSNAAKIFFQETGATSNITTASAPNMSLAGAFGLLAADHAVSGKTTKLFLHAQQITATTAPTITIVVGLYPFTVSSTASLGTVVTGSTVTFTTPSSNTQTDSNSGDFTLPSDGLYCPGFTVSGTPAGAQTALFAQLYVHNV